jgi:hypothetical protein
MMIVALTAQGASFLHVRRNLSARRRQSILLPTGTQKIQAAATNATAACCSPQNPVNMDYLSNYGNDESAKKLVGEILDQFGWDAAEWGRLKLPALLSRCACFKAF